MIAITSYESVRYGFTFPEAALKVEEITSRTSGSFYDPNDPTPKNSLVRIKVYANQAAHDDGKEPIEYAENFMDFPTADLDAQQNNALLTLYPTATIIP